MPDELKHVRVGMVSWLRMRTAVGGAGTKYRSVATSERRASVRLTSVCDYMWSVSMWLRRAWWEVVPQRMRMVNRAGERVLL